MPSKVSLKVTQGDLQGQEYVFDERSTCIIGRSVECSVKIPNDAAHKMISRHHCLLDINPPDIRVRDFGSLHSGTAIPVKLPMQAAHLPAGGRALPGGPGFNR